MICGGLRKRGRECRSGDFGTHGIGACYGRGYVSIQKAGGLRERRVDATVLRANRALDSCVKDDECE